MGPYNAKIHNGTRTFFLLAILSFARPLPVTAFFYKGQF
jgi:hypothetical protein